MQLVQFFITFGMTNKIMGWASKLSSWRLKFGDKVAGVNTPNRPLESSILCDEDLGLSIRCWATFGFYINNLAICSLLMSCSSTADTCVVPFTYERRRGGGLPYTTSKGEIPVEECEHVLNHHSARDNHFAQSFGRIPTKHLRKFSRHRLTTLDCPTVWGWYAKLSLSWVTYSLNSSCQKLLVKTGSLSLTMKSGMPWSLNMWSRNRRATVDAV